MKIKPMCPLAEMPMSFVLHSWTCLCLGSHLECGSKVSLMSSGLTKLSDSCAVPTDGVSRALFRLLPSHELNLGEEVELVSLNVGDSACLFLSQD